MVIGTNGTYEGSPGYSRGFVPRTAAGFDDATMVNLIPPNGRSTGNEILATDPICKSTQQTLNQTNGFPRLQAPAGSFIAIRYQENGHVTLPQNQPGKPANRGTVSIYGTEDPNQNDTLKAIHNVWNTAGTGGDKRGKLLATADYDDKQCYQVNGGPISTSRQAQFKHTADQVGGADLLCQNNIVLPSDATVGKPYTIYWIWDWPTAPNVDPSLPQGKLELYTTCADIDITAGSPKNETATFSYAAGQPVNSAAVSSYFVDLVAGSSLLAVGGPSTAPVAGSTSSAIPAGSTSQAASQAPVPAPAAPSAAAPQASTPVPASSPASASVPQASTDAPLPPTAPATTMMSMMTMTVTEQVLSTVTVSAEGDGQPLSPQGPSAASNATSVTALSAPTVAPLPPSSGVPAAPATTVLTTVAIPSGTATALTTSATGTYSAPPAIKARCLSCRTQKRSRILGSADSESDSTFSNPGSAKFRLT